MKHSVAAALGRFRLIDRIACSARLRRVGLALLGVLLAIVVALYLTVRASLPQLDGTLSLTLDAPVTVGRDALGTAIITAQSRGDAYFAQGFVHAQERFFEMDLTRRSAAGELAELFGAAALPRDRAHRVHRMRARLSAFYPTLPAAQRALLERYCAGVNAGLHALTARPWTYALLRSQPRDWAPLDTLLVNAAMAFNLQDDTNVNELNNDTAKRTLSPAAYAFLFNRVSEKWDAPLMQATGAISEFPDPPMPTSAELDFRNVPDTAFKAIAARGSEAVRGSNNWAVAGAITETGSAMLANDMHLGLGVPSIWFRQQLNYKTATGNIRITGLSLPGAPGTVVGSNGKVAWGNTNSYGDWLDFVRLVKGKGDDSYFTANGEELITTVEEIIHVKGAPDDRLGVRETRYGPVVGKDSVGNELALAWVIHRPGGVDANAIDFELSQTSVELLDRARHAGVPHNNILAADSTGHIGWTISGQIPLRAPQVSVRASAPDINLDGDKNLPIPSSQLNADVWQGFMAENQMRAPEVLDPPELRLFTANARVVNRAADAFIGNGGYALGARASRIRDLLNARKTYFRETDMLTMQLDDQAPLLEPWWQLLNSQIQGQSRYAGVAELIGGWNRRASVESVAYRIVRGFRAEILAEYVNAFAAPMRVQNPSFSINFPGHAEVMVWPILTAQAAHLLPKPHQSYTEFKQACLDRALAKIIRKLTPEQAALAPFAVVTLADSEITAAQLKAHIWGEQNTAKIQHPLAKALPILSWFLDMPSDPLPGDTGHIVRAQGPAFGASERLSVSPGHEDKGLLQMPGGQSGHPLSPFYGAGHRAWVNGEPSPLLPGKVLHVLTLAPQKTPGGAP
jgi:penicillin G amidase